MKETLSRVRWLDCAKFAAILAVIIDHMNGILYTNSKLMLASFYSVALFILVSGYTMYQSARKRKEAGYTEQWRRIRKILWPYALAVFIIQILTMKSFVFETYLSYLFRFNILDPHYYVLLYVQLILAAPILVAVLKQDNVVYTVVGMMVLVVFAMFSNNKTDILGVYGGGGALWRKLSDSVVHRNAICPLWIVSGKN